MAGETELDRMVVRLMGDGSSYFNMLRKAETATLSVSRRLRAAGARLSSIGRGMTMRLTAPLALIGGLGVRAFANFDRAMIESTSIMKVTEEQTAKMRETALSLSGEAAQSPAELAKAYFFLASAGKTAEQSMSLLPSVSRFATAGAFDMALATDLLTDAQSALGMSTRNVARDTKNMARVSDVLVKANTLANASVQQFSTALTSKAGAALKAYNKDVEEGVAVLAALADQGVKAELAGNALDRVIRLSTKGALDNAKAHKRLGFEVFNEAGKMRNLGDIVGNLEQVLKGMSDKQRAASLDAMGFQARVQGVILPLLGTSKAIKSYEKELRAAGGTTRDVAAKQMKSFSNQLKLVWNQLTIVGIEIGKVLAPVLLRLGNYLKSGLKWWKALSPAIKKAVVITGLLVAVVGPLLMGLGGLISLVGLTVAGLGAMVGVLSTVVSMIGAIFSPVILLATAFAALGVAVIYWTGAGGKAVAWFAQQWQRLVDHVQPALDGIRDALASSNLSLAFKILWAQIELTFAVGIAPLRRAWVNFVMTFKVLWAEAVTFLRNTWNEATGGLALAWEALRYKITGDMDRLLSQTVKIAGQMTQITKGIASARKKALAEAGKDALSDMLRIEKNIRDLEKQRDRLVAKSAVERVAKIGKQQMPEMPIVPKFELPPGVPAIKLPVSIDPIEATRAGSIEAAKRMAEFRSRALAIEGAPMGRQVKGRDAVRVTEIGFNKTNQHLAKLISLGKQQLGKNFLEDFEPADL